MRTKMILAFLAASLVPLQAQPAGPVPPTPLADAVVVVTLAILMVLTAKVDWNLVFHRPKKPASERSAEPSPPPLPWPEN